MKMEKIKEKKQYYYAGEGDQEELYFSHLKSLINKNPSARYTINFKRKNTNGGSPLEVAKEANRLLTFGDVKKNLVAAVFDYDFKDESFIEAIHFCSKNNVIASYSNINFELWLLLHKVNYRKIISNNKGYIKDLKKEYHLNKDDDIKKDNVISKILSQIDIDDIKTAIKNCYILEKEKKASGEEIHDLKGHYTQPYLKIYLFVEQILKDSEL